jgi:hypothetical protein
MGNRPHEPGVAWGETMARWPAIFRPPPDPAICPIVARVNMRPIEANSRVTAREVPNGLQAATRQYGLDLATKQVLLEFIATNEPED